MSSRPIRHPHAVAAALALALTGSVLAGADRSTDYLGLEPPGQEPEIFAPGVVSTGLNERDVALTPDGGELYYTVSTPGAGYSVIMVVRRVAGVWGQPEVAPFSGAPEVRDLEPFVSPDGGRLFFVSTRGQSEDNAALEDIWVMDRQQSGWGEPRNLGAPVNTAAGEFFPSVTADGTLYFTRDEVPGGESAIYRSRVVDGAYAEPERLPPQVNSGASRFNAFVASDESFLILSILGRDDSLGGIDYYVVYRDADDSWSQPVNLGPTVNTGGNQEYSPYLTRNGKYFFFMSARSASRPTGRLTAGSLRELAASPGAGSSDIYWVDAGFLASLKPSTKLLRSTTRGPEKLPSHEAAEVTRQTLVRCGLPPEADPAAAPWYFHWELGVELAERGDPQRALDALLAAVERRPLPKENARMYGMWFTHYRPYLLIAESHARLGNWSCAFNALELAKSTGEAASTDDTVLGRYRKLRTEVEGQLAGKQ